MGVFYNVFLLSTVEHGVDKPVIEVADGVPAWSHAVSPLMTYNYTRLVTSVKCRNYHISIVDLSVKLLPLVFTATYRLITTYI